MTNLSEHFSLDEAVISQTASRNGLDNTPPPEIVVIMMQTANKLERIRALLNQPIIINSWYRSEQVNKAVGGVDSSQHIKGEAVDFICPAFGTCLEICKRILEYPELIIFDQLILEHTWVHMSFSSNPNVPNRKQVLSLLENGHYSIGLTDKQGNAL